MAEDTPTTEPADAPVAPALDLKQDFGLIVDDIYSSRRALEQGKDPAFESPNDVIRSYASQAGMSELDYSEALKAEGYDIYEAADKVGVKGDDVGEYLKSADTNRQTVKDLYEEERGPKVVRESRERITEALKQKDPTTLPKEVVSSYLGPVVQDPSKGFILDNDVSVKFSGEESGIFNTGEANQRERLTDLSPRAEATQLAQILVANDDRISKYVDLYGSSVDGADRYLAQRLGDMADRTIKDDPSGLKRDAFVNDQANKQKALREIAILRTAGLWTAPILVNPEMLLGEDRELPGTLLGDLQAGIKTAFSPTIEIIGVADRKNNSALVARQASAMRTAFDVMDIPQQIVTGVLREADSKPLGEAALSVASSPVRWLTDDNLRKEVIGSLGRKDELFSYALESEMARAGTEGMVAAATLGLAASVFFPDTFFLAGKLGKVSKLGQAAENIKDARNANRAVTYMGRVEESANDMEAIDKLEGVFLNIDGKLQSDLRRDTNLISVAMHESGKKGDRIANMGKEASEVIDLLPDGRVTVKGADGEDIFFDNMRLRAPHLAPSLRRGRATDETGNTTVGYAEAYNLNNRRKEFESLKKAAETRDPTLIAPQFRVDNRKAINTFASKYQAATGGKVPFFFRTGDEILKKGAKVSGRTFGSAPIGAAMRGPDEFKAFIRSVTDFDNLSADQQKKVDKLATSFAKKAQKWTAKNSDKAFDNLDSAINKGLKAVQANHEARVVASSVNRQKIAKRFGIDAPVKNPQLLEAADKLPQFSPSARSFRESLIDRGVDDSLATFITGTLDARARRYSARTGEDTKRWWDSRIEGATKADPPKPAAPTPAAPTPAKPAAPTAPAKPKKKAPKRPKKPPAKPPKTTAVPEGLQPPAYVEPPAPSAAAKKKADPTKFKLQPHAAHVFDDETRQPQELLEHLIQFGSFGARQVNEKGGAQLVDWLSKHGSSAVTRTIAARIEPILQKSKMEVRLHGDKGVTPTGYNANYREARSFGYHQRASGDQPIVLGINVHGGMNEGTIIHELLHAATVPALAAASRAPSGSDLRKSADRLEEVASYVVDAARRRAAEVRRIKKADRTPQQVEELRQANYIIQKSVLGSGKGPSAQTELISHAVSNGLVTKFMKTLPPMDKAAGNSVFSEFVDLIARLFNKGKAVSKADRSAFEDAIEASEEFLTQSEIYYYGTKNVDGLPKGLANSTEGPQSIAEAKLKSLTQDELPEAIGISKDNTLETVTDFAKKESDGLVPDPEMRTDQVLVDEDNKIAAVLSESLTGEGDLLNEYRINVNVRPDMKDKGIANALIDDAIMKFETEYVPDTADPIMEIRVNTSYDPSVAAHLESRGFVATATEKLKLFGKKDPAEVKTFRYEPENVARVGEPDIQLAAKPPTPVTPPPSPELIIADDGRALLKGFENADLNDVVRATTQVIVRDLDTVELDGLIKYLNDQGISVSRKGADITGDAADVERAFDALGDVMADYVKTGELPLQAKGLKKVFEDMRSDVLNSYRMAKLVKADIPESIRDVMEPLLRSMPADEEPLPTVLETIRTKLLGTPPDRTKQARDLLEDIRKEALRQGTDVDYDDLIRKIDEFKDTNPKKVVLETDRPLFPAFTKVKPDETTGKYRYNVEDIADIQRRIQEAPGSPESIYLEDAYESSLLTTKRRDRSAVEKFYGLTREGAKDKRSLADLKAALKEDSYFDDEFLDDIISRGDIFADEIANRVRPVIRILGKSILGGDELADLADVSPVVQQKILAGEKMVQQAVGDSVRLTTEVHANKGDLKAKALDQLYTYLSGGNAVFVRGGRAAVSSGTDKFMDLASEAQDFVNNTLKKKEKRALQDLMNAVNPKVLPDGRVVSPAPTSDVMKGIEAGKGFKKGVKALEKLFRGDGYQFFADFNKSIVVQADKGLDLSAYQAYESLFYNLGITNRNGKPVLPVDDGLSSSLNSKNRVKAFLDEIQNGRQGAQDKPQFGAHSNESAVTRIAVLLGSHGTARRVRQLWADSGMYVDAKVTDALSKWNQGLAIEPSLMPDVDRVARTFGLNPNLVQDPVLGLDKFIPQQARVRLSDALARGLVKDTGTMLKATEDDLSGLWQTYNRFLKISMVRGAYVLKQRYFFMNTYDHFNQLAQTVGFAPALASTLRVVTNDITVFPGAAPVLALLAKNRPDAPEAFRKWIQRGGDKLSNLITDMVSNSKWRVGVNEVLDGRDGFVRIGGNVYSYKQLRNIATEEGIFSSFDTSNLRKSLTAADAEQQRAAADKLGSALTDTSNFHGWYRTHLDDTAEAWSERERVGAMITLIEMGADPRAAARTTIEALYDYAGSMSKGDRNVWINIIFPFWSFQKNANRQFVNNLFSLTGVYRMNVLRRGRERLADAASELMYQSITDQYGINEEALPPETRQYYMGFKKQIENGLGPIEDLDPATAQMLRRQYGVDDLNKLPPDQKEFLENGYGGREKVPPRVVQEIRLVLSGEVRPGQPFSFEGGKPQVFESGAENYVLDFFQQSDEFQKIRLAAVRRPDKTARRSYLRDRLGIALPFEPTPSARLYYQMMGQISPDHGYFEVFLPESAMEASMRHVAGIAATVIMGSGMLAGQAVSTVTGAAERVTGLPVGVDAGAPADISMTAIRENLRTVADVERAPMLAQLLFPFTGDSTAPPIRIHPWLANVIQTELPYLNLLEIKGKNDLFALIESGEMDEQEAYQVFTSDPGVVALQDPIDLSDDAYVQVQELHPQVDPALIQKIVDVSRTLEIPADALAAAIQAESNFDPSITNARGSRATGLIQFMPSTAKGMGTTVEDLAAMSAVDQMAYVHRYLAPYKGKIKSEADINMAIFYPRAIGKSDDFDIADDYYEVKLRQFKREGLSDEQAKNRAGGAWKRFVAQNPGIRTRGDYLQMAERTSSQKADHGEEIPTPTTRLPSRAKEGYELTEDRFYMFPGPMAIFMQLSGLTELNRMLMSELPLAKTPLTRAGVGEDYLDTPQGRIAIPNNRVGIALWANYVLGLQSAEVTRGATAKAEEPKAVTKRVGLPK